MASGGVGWVESKATSAATGGECLAVRFLVLRQPLAVLQNFGADAIFLGHQGDKASCIFGSKCPKRQSFGHDHSFGAFVGDDLSCQLCISALIV